MSNSTIFDVSTLYKYIDSTSLDYTKQLLPGCTCGKCFAPTDRALQTIESNGTVDLLRDSSTNLISVSVNNLVIPVRLNNKQISANQFADREILAAETINGENRILWREVSTGKIRTWLLDSKWNFVNNNNPLVDPNSTAGLLLTQQFLSDTTTPLPINTTLQVLDPNGSVQLLRDTVTDLVSVRINGSTLAVRFNGAQLKSNQFADRQILAAETINGENRILWREVSTGKIRTWLLDSKWNYVNNNNSLVDLNSSQGTLLQQQFQLISEPIVESNSITLKSLFDFSKTFFLHSNPTATKTIFLDFDGHYVANTPWENGGNLRLSGFYSSINDTSRTEIQRIWARVSEDFAPFNVNVTTQDPGADALINSGGTDDRWGIRVAFTNNINLLTGTAIKNAGGGGTAYYGSFNWATDDVALVFNRGAYTAAETASHEIGHTLGLRHDGSGTTTEYYGGHGGTGPTSWGTIMGAAWLGNDEVVTQWSKGEYTGANTTQDDLAAITGPNGFTYRVDDHGNDFNTSTVLTGTQFSAFGIIERNTDIDMFKFTTGAGLVTFDILNSVRSYINNNGLYEVQYLTTQGPNLDIAATLYRENGSILQVFNPSDLTTASFSTTLEAGTYYLGIDGVGVGNPLGSTPTGYTDYGSLGQYIINAKLPSESTPPSTNTSLQVVDPNGPTQLVLDTTTDLISIQTTIANSPLIFKGAQVKSNQFNDWQILAAENIAGNNKILWKQLSTGKLHTWAVDGNWNYIKSEAIVAPSSTQGIILQNQFMVDSTGKPLVVGSNIQTIDPNGSVKLIRDNSTDLVSIEVAEVSTPIRFKGVQVKSNQFKGWQILAAETVNTNQNKILWKELSTGKLHTWAVDSNWNYISSEAIVSPSSTQGLVLQQQFNVDSSGNPIIAQAPATTIDPITGLAHIELAPVDTVGEVWYSNPIQAIGAADTVEHIMSVDSYIPLLETNTLTSVIMNNDVFSNTNNI